MYKKYNLALARVTRLGTVIKDTRSESRNKQNKYINN